MVEDKDYFKMLKRMIKAGAKRAGEGDEEELADFYEISKFFNEQIKASVQMQINNNKSWQDIGDSLGMSKQGAYKKFNK